MISESLKINTTLTILSLISDEIEVNDNIKNRNIINIKYKKKEEKKAKEI